MVDGDGSDSEIGLCHRSAVSLQGCPQPAIYLSCAPIEGQDADVRTAHTLEQNAFGLVFASDDRIEGTSAFVEKRDPSFTGR